MKIATAIYPVRNERVYLPIKKTTVGIDKRFPYGGKQEEDETIRQCAVRELKDESGIEVSEEKLKLQAIIFFYRGKEKPESPTYKVYFYVCKDFKGEPSVDGREMTDARHFPIKNLPYKEMKAGDELFTSRILSGEKVTGWIWFEDDDTYRDHDLNIIDELSDQD
jgi:ADP-ribose pyrophosphatase YjhB (NUDIX family)